MAGRVAVVTGAGRGIGLAIARAVAGMGAHTVLAARTAGEIERAARGIQKAGGSASFFRSDLTHEDDIVALFAHVRKRHGRLDVLVNNAGMGIYGPLAELKARDFDEVIAVNLRGTFLCCREALRLMIPARSGYIINISSVVGFRGYANQTSYTAAKHGVVGLTKALAAEVQEHGIRVSVVMPGGVYTDMVAKARPDLAPADLMLPDDVAGAVVFLLSLSDRAAVDRIHIRRRNGAPF